MKFIYSFFLYLISPFFLYSLYKKKTGKPAIGYRWKEHFGFSTKLTHPKKDVIWFHAVSVGEVIAATPLIKNLKARCPDSTIIMTTTTSTGAAEVAKLDNIVEHRYMPLDFSFAVERFIKRIKPRSLLIMETELWPNTLHAAKKHNIPVTIINARLSERSFTRYQKFPFIFDLLLKNISLILCQTNEDAQRFIKLGVAEKNIAVTGSIKFDISVSPDVIAKGAVLRNELGINRPIWIAASTHEGEDEQILKVHQTLLKAHPTALLIIVPRHPERFLSVASLANNSGFNVITRTSKNAVSNTDHVYIADTMGEMLQLIGASDVCFMGGSLIGDKVGGHNLLEPAALSKSCLIGASFYNFKLITEQLVENNGGVVCHTIDDISEQLVGLFNSPEKNRLMGKNALEVVTKNRGAIDKTLVQLIEMPTSK